jgi:TonB family protein
MMKNTILHLVLSLSLGVVFSMVHAAELPAANSGDTPLKIIDKVNPAFPYRLIENGITRGEAQVVFLVDSTGKLADWLITAYTHKEFADVALAAIKTWKFEPSQAAGKPIGTVVDMSFLYQINGVVVIDRKPDLVLRTEQWGAEGKYSYQPCPAQKLDRPPQAVRALKPVYPKELGEQGIVGKVLVEFYIDEQGKARLPIASQSSNKTLAAIAIAAVDQWQFEPPTRQGKPVLVSASQEFNFEPGK